MISTWVLSATDVGLVYFYGAIENDVGGVCPVLRMQPSMNQAVFCVTRRSRYQFRVADTLEVGGAEVQANWK